MNDVDVTEDDVNSNFLAKATVLLLEKTPLIEFSKRLEKAFVEYGRELSGEIGEFSIFDNLSYNPHLEDYLCFDSENIMHMILSCYTEDYELEVGNVPANNYYFYLIEEEECSDCERYVRDFIESDRGITEEIRNEIKQAETPEIYMEEKNLIYEEESVTYCYVHTENEELKALLKELCFVPDPYDWMTYASLAMPEWYEEADISFDTDTLLSLITHLESLPTRRNVCQGFMNVLIDTIEGKEEPYLLHMLRSTTFESNEEVLF